MIASNSIRSLTAGAFFVAAFRPFFLLGAVFGVIVLLQSVGYISGLLSFESQRLSFSLWHGHELIHGFAGAIVVGFILTALPGWAGCREIDGARLMLLVLLWLAGRILFQVAATHGSSVLSLQGAAVVDSSLFIVASMLISHDLLRARNRFYLVVFPIFAGFYVGNALFYFAVLNLDYGLAGLALKVSLFAIIFKFVVVGGYLTVVFSNNVLADRGLPLIRFHTSIEACAVLSIVLMFLGLVTGFNSSLLLICSLFALISHLLRWLNMRFWLVAHEPLLLTMNLAYGWLLVSLLLKVLYEAGLLGNDIWLHAFTVGAMGTMMMSLMTRVALRHTGRPLRLSESGRLILGMAALSAVFRVFLGAWDTVFVMLSGVIFSAGLIIYLGLYGVMLLRPSRPKRHPAGGMKGAG